jgi:YegS/Rv2252/BmrU family lipid kinase
VKPFLVVNPKSAGGLTERAFQRILAAVRGAIGEVDWAFTGRIGDGVRLAGQAYAAGRRFVIAVGGDGTSNEVFDGLARAGGIGDAKLDVGVIPSGTGGDLRRSLGIGDDLATAARAVADPDVLEVDLGRAELTGPQGERFVRHFANVATCGVSAVVASHVNRGHRFGSGRLTYFVAGARAMLDWSDRQVRWRVDGGPWRVEPITAISCCNGRFFGGGMKVAPAALIDDGLFDVVLWKGYGTLDLVLQRRKLYDGRHVLLPKTEVLRGRELEVEPLTGPPMMVDLDGEQPGFLPARFTIVPRALRVRVGKRA